MNLVKDTLCFFFSSPTSLFPDSSGLLQMSAENNVVVGFFFYDCVHRCACVACGICQSRVWGWCAHWCMLVGLCVYHVMLWPRQELSPQRKSTANNSTAIGMEPYHPRGLWDRVYNQTQSVGGQNL